MRSTLINLLIFSELVEKLLAQAVLTKPKKSITVNKTVTVNIQKNLSCTFIFIPYIRLVYKTYS